MPEKALVLLSGGLDSAVALYWALEQGHRVETITYNYFLRSRREIYACKKIAHRARVNNIVINLDFLREVADSRSQSTNPILRRAPSAYIPSRNAIFYGIASSLAETLDAKYIIGGHNKDDVRTFPDASQVFFQLFNRVTALGKFSKGRTGRVILPLSKLTKKGVVKLGSKLGVPFEFTWSCYKTSKQVCGKCPACRLRQSAFDEAHLIDPLRAVA